MSAPSPSARPCQWSSARRSDISRRSGISIWDAELELIGFTHAELGGRLAERWNLPTRIAEAVARHHEALASPAADGLAGVVAFADRVAGHFGVHCGYRLAAPAAGSYPTRSRRWNWPAAASRRCWIERMPSSAASPARHEAGSWTTPSPPDSRPLVAVRVAHEHLIRTLYGAFALSPSTCVSVLVPNRSPFWANGGSTPGVYWPGRLSRAIGDFRRRTRQLTP